MSARKPGVLTFPTVAPGTPDGIVERLAAARVPSDYRKDDAGVHVWTFPGPERFCAYAAAEVVAYGQAGEYRPLISDHPPGDAWSGADFPHAFYMGTVAGWPEAARLALDLYDRLTAHRLASRIPTIRYEDEPGEDVDVGAYLSGEDATFLVTADTDVARMGGRSAVRLRHSLFLSSGVTAEQAVIRGIAALAIVHLLETAGVRVAVELDMSWSKSNRNGRLTCALKHYGEPADLPRLAFWLAHPAALRRVVFAATSAQFTNHYHRPEPDDDDVIRVGGAMVGYGDVDAAELVKGTLAQAGFELM